MNQTLKESEKVVSPTQTSLGASPTETSCGSSERFSKRDTPDTRELVSPEKKSFKGSGDSVHGRSQSDDHGKRPAPTSEEKLSPEKKTLKVNDDPEEPVVPRSLFAESPAKLENPEKSESLPELKVAEPKPVEKTPEQLMLAQALEQIQALSNKVLQLESEKNKSLKVQKVPVANPQNKKEKALSSAPSSDEGSKLTSPDHTPVGSDDDSKDDGKEKSDGEKSQELMTFPNGSRVISHDALRMRLRRLVEVKPKTKKCHVDEATREQYSKGGEDREWLEIALMEAIQKVGAENRKHKALRDQKVEAIKVDKMKEITEEGHTPVLPELVQFMDKVHGKMMLVQTNLGKLEIEGDVAANPATKELMKDWDAVRLNLKQVFQSLAEVKADMTIGSADAAESEKFTWLHLYLTWVSIYLGFSIANFNRIQEKNP
eukprot:s380_g22.t1